MWTSQTSVMLLQEVKRMNWPNRYLKVRERLVASLFFDIANAEMKMIPGSITRIRHMKELATHTIMDTDSETESECNRVKYLLSFLGLPHAGRWISDSVEFRRGWGRSCELRLQHQLKVLKIFEAASNTTAGCLTKVLSHDALIFGRIFVSSAAKCLSFNFNLLFWR